MSRARTTPPVARPRLLVVDDEEYNLDLVRRTFHRTATVRTAATAAAALSLLAAETFDAAMIDHRLADGTGLELARTLRARWPALRLVIVTGYPDEPVLLAGRAAGLIDDLLGKPWNPADLRARVLGTGTGAAT